MAVFHLCLLALFAAYTKASYVFSNSIVAAGGDYNVSYNFNASVDTLEFLVEVRATGWVGFGFALLAPNTMINYDVAVGGVLSNGTGYLRDYNTTGRFQPPLDDQQDWHLINSSEQNGITTLKFYRQRNTTDVNDLAIEQGMSVFLILAYHSSSDVEPGQFIRHTYRNWTSVTLIPSASSTVSTVSATSSMTPVVAQITTSTVEATSTSRVAAMTTVTLIPSASSTVSTVSASSSMTPVVAQITTSTVESTSTSTVAAMTTSALVATDTLTTSTIAPATTNPNPTPTASSSVVPTMPVNPANSVSLDNGKYNVSWTFNSSTDTLHFMVEVRTSGWVGFGVATQAPTNMMGYDIAVGGVFNGAGYIRDYFTNGQMQPPEDPQQDWTLSYSGEENGVTTLRFYRKRNTSDTQNDIAIQQGMSIFLIWAYHSSNDVPSGQFIRHTSPRGNLPNVVLIPAATPTTATPTPTVRPTHFANFLSFNGGNYNVSWMVNRATNSIYFMVEVRTTGWVGCGVAIEAPNSMMSYDVGVGGVLRGSGYLRDYFTRGFSRPPVDPQQDLTLSYAREESGVTTLRFHRSLNTNDANDVAIQEGMQLYVIWAYHAMSDVPESGQFPQHTFQGSQKVTLFPAAPGFMRGFDNNRYLLSWRFDDQADKMYYHVRVKTTGWVGFGFAKTAPNTMIDYDVVVAGFDNGAGYIYDYKTIGRTRPSPDASQDYKLINASEAGGYTELWFERPRDTKDENDIAFLPGEGVHFIWAYSTMDITDQNTFGIHSMSGWTEDQVIQVAAQQPIPTERSGSSPCSSIYGIVTFAIALFAVLLV